MKGWVFDMEKCDQRWVDDYERWMKFFARRLAAEDRALLRSYVDVRPWCADYEEVE